MGNATVKIKKDTHQKLKVLAAETGHTIQEIAEAAFLQLMKPRGKK